MTDAAVDMTKLEADVREPSAEIAKFIPSKYRTGDNLLAIQQSYRKALLDLATEHDRQIGDYLKRNKSMVDELSRLIGS